MTESDFKERSEAFIKAYGELVETHGVDFATYPQFVPDGNSGFKIVCQTTPVDMKNRPVPSPVEFIPAQ